MRYNEPTHTYHALVRLELNSGIDDRQRGSIVPRLMLFLLGRPRIERDGAPVEVDTRKAIALIAYLAVTHQHHSRAELAALLWPEYNHVRAYANLRRTVWALNKALAGDYLNVDRDAIGLNPDADLWLDVDQFAAALATSRAHDHRGATGCSTCLELLTEVVELYRDGFMYGFALSDSANFEEWQFFQAEHLQRDFVGALERLVDEYSARGQFETAIPYARQWLALDTLHEPAQRALMRLYAWSGQHSAALRQYQECLRALEEGLGVAPQETTTQLYQAIKTKQLPAPQPESQPAPDPETASPAAHNGDGNGARAPVLETMQVLHLPSQSGPFVGRAEELDKIAALIRDPACRLLTLVGPGGIGKTRLAVQAASEQREAFAHGIYFVSCATINSTTLLLSAVADALRFSFYAAGDPKRQLLDFLRSKHLLLLVDSAEQLVGAVELLTEIVIEAPAVKILATSIERLNLQEEWALEVQGLHYPEHEAASEFEQYGAIQLFFQSARRVHADFAPADADKPCIARICRLVAGMPLGIELATSWLRMLSCQEIVREVESNLDFLATSLRNVPERHRSMRAVFEHSWKLLSEQEQRVLGRLAIFQGGCRREAAERVAGATLPLLLGLVDKSLLHRTAAGRYEMLGVIRQYAQEKLNEAARAETQALHCGYYADVLRRYGESIKGGPQQEALSEIRQELENIRTGWAWAVEQGWRPEIQIFASNLYLFFEIQGRFQEGEEHFREVAQRIAALPIAGEEQAEADRLLVAQMRAYQGGFCYRLGRNEHAAQLLHELLAVFRGRAALAETAFCLACLGDIARIKGQYHVAREALEESLAICTQSGDRAIAAKAYTNLGIVAGALGEYREARQLFREGLTIFQALGDRWGEARALINLGIIAYYLLEYGEAQQLLRASLAIARMIDNHYGIAVALNNLGIIAYKLEQYSDSQQLHLESCAMFEQIGYRLGVGLTLNDLGQVARACGEEPASRAYFDAALRTAMEIQAPPLALDALVGIAALQTQTEPERTLELLYLVSLHPASGKETRDRALGLLTDLNAPPPAPQDASTGTPIPTRTLEEVAAQLLARQPPK